VHVSYIEIYKEELRDLIDNTVTSQEIHIREDERGHTGMWILSIPGEVGYQYMQYTTCVN